MCINVCNINDNNINILIMILLCNDKYVIILM